MTQLVSSATGFTDLGAGLDSAGVPSLEYEIQVMYSNGGLSLPATAIVSTNPPAPANLSSEIDATGANVFLSWSAVVGPVQHYDILRGVYNPNNGTYSYSRIATVNPNVLTYEDVGAITSGNSHNNSYEVFADFGGGLVSLVAESDLTGSSPATSGGTSSTNNFNLSAQLVRNQTGRWQLMVSSFPSNIVSVALYWNSYDYWIDAPEFDQSFGIPEGTETDIPVTNFVNGIYVVPDFALTNTLPVNQFGKLAMVQPIGQNNLRGNISWAGFVSGDAPCFVDGRRHLKQNMMFEIRAAGVNSPFSFAEENIYFNPSLVPYPIPTDPAYVESSIFHASIQYKESEYDSIYYLFMKMDNLWPFTLNYQLHRSLYDTNYTGTNTFVWLPNVAVTVPAPAILGLHDPYWISQSTTNWADLGASTNDINLYLQGGAKNLFGLAFVNALVNEGGYNDEDEYVPQLSVNYGNNTGLTNVDCFFSQTADPSTQLVNYYFAPVSTPGAELPNGPSPQFYPIPSNVGFSPTNQTGVMITSVGTPTVIASWAKYAIVNSPKYAYLGQYFMTNAFVVTNGIVTTNSTGVVSPYGDFFPTAPGMAAMTTMPDIDSGLQATGIVRVISLNVDANHDGTMDFTYGGPDFVSANKPFRFWANDNQDAGDDGGNFGVPGAAKPDGFTQIQEPLSVSELYYSYFWFNPNPSDWIVHGRRDLVDFFPVYLNIGSLFQSNALSAGISVTDTNWQFVLSQADGILRFTETPLTPTNYMNFLRDTNMSGLLADAPLTTITTNGIALTNTFISDIANNNGGIILVEAATNTTAPLVLTIYHGTNQIAQTQLYLSISGVEQMFRNKNLMLNPNDITPVDRLTDASVPNEPDTIGKNFVFLHGYNVNTNEARGVGADMYKRMYWSGSHAKFWAVTWEGADSQLSVKGETLFTPNYHTNVVNAFITAPRLSSFISTLTDSGPVVAAAHSLGNMVVLSAISDWNAPISQYFMMDAAVPVEAIDPAAVTNFMVYSTGLNNWPPYTNRLYPTSWHLLFPTNDARSTLTWNNRLGNLGSVDIYNFYSTGEEVLRTTNSDPPPGVLTMIAGQLTFHFWDNLPFGTYTWYWQEKGKGTASQDWFLGSSHGGWKMNYYPPYLYSSNGFIAFTSPAQALTIPNSQLMTNAFFDVTSTNWGTADLALYGGGGSSYAQANRSRLLADVFPAMSVVAGANPIPSFDNNHNKDMMTLENGWSLGRLTSGERSNNWHHSDFVQMAYTFTHQLFDQFVTTGNLK